MTEASLCGGDISAETWMAGACGGEEGREMGGRGCRPREPRGQKPRGKRTAILWQVLHKVKGIIQLAL